MVEKLTRRTASLLGREKNWVYCLPTLLMARPRGMTMKAEQKMRSQSIQSRLSLRNMRLIQLEPEAARASTKK